MIRPARVRVSTHHKLTTMAKAVNMMNARVAGNGVQTTRTALSAAWQTDPPGPNTKDRPCSAWLIRVNTGPCKKAGGLNSTATRPQMSCTNSSTM